MWLSKQAAQKARQARSADVGLVSIAGVAPAVITDAEKRDLTVFAPGGYCWRPAVGEQALVLKAGETEAVAGVKMPASDLEAGEVRIMTGDTVLSMKDDGSVSLLCGGGSLTFGTNGTSVWTNGAAAIEMGSGNKLELTGRVTVNGLAISGGL